MAPWPRTERVPWVGDRCPDPAPDWAPLTRCVRWGNAASAAGRSGFLWFLGLAAPQRALARGLSRSALVLGGVCSATSL